jgi:hypothetical protein
LFAKGVAKFNELFFFANWAVPISYISVPLSRTHQIRISIAGINGSTKEGYQGSSLIE